VDRRKGRARIEHEAVVPDHLVRVVEQASGGTSHQYRASLVPPPTVRKGGCC
jgi:hypothetical protein